MGGSGVFSRSSEAWDSWFVQQLWCWHESFHLCFVVYPLMIAHDMIQIGRSIKKKLFQICIFLIKRLGFLMVLSTVRMPGCKAFLWFVRRSQAWGSGLLALLMPAAVEAVFTARMKAVRRISASA